MTNFHVLNNFNDCTSQINLMIVCKRLTIEFKNIYEIGVNYLIEIYLDLDSISLILKKPNKCS